MRVVVPADVQQRIVDAAGSHVQAMQLERAVGNVQLGGLPDGPVFTVRLHRAIDRALDEKVLHLEAHRA